MNRIVLGNGADLSFAQNVVSMNRWINKYSIYSVISLLTRVSLIREHSDYFGIIIVDGVKRLNLDLRDKSVDKSNVKQDVVQIVAKESNYLWVNVSYLLIRALPFPIFDYEFLFVLSNNDEAKHSVNASLNATECNR